MPVMSARFLVAKTRQWYPATATAANSFARVVRYSVHRCAEDRPRAPRVADRTVRGNQLRLLLSPVRPTGRARRVRLGSAPVLLRRRAQERRRVRADAVLEPVVLRRQRVV